MARTAAAAKGSLFFETLPISLLIHRTHGDHSGLPPVTASGASLRPVVVLRRGLRALASLIPPTLHTPSARKHVETSSSKGVPLGRF